MVGHTAHFLVPLCWISANIDAHGHYCSGAMYLQTRHALIPHSRPNLCLIAWNQVDVAISANIEIVQ